MTRVLGTDELGGWAAATFLVGVEGTRLDAPLERWLHELRPAGILLFGRNVESTAQVATLCSDLQELAADAGFGRLFMAIDQEGGGVQRLTAAAGFTETPSAMALGAGGEPAAARAMAGLVGAELRAIGVHTALGPVADVTGSVWNPAIGTRSFGADPVTVGAFVTAAVEGAREAGVLSVAKHFPGHGRTATDSHEALPQSSATATDLRSHDIAPFRAAIAAHVDAIMVGHLLTPFDAAHPASLSRRIVSRLLRDELEFAGLLCTDSLDMRALHGGGRRADVGALAIAAGVDLLLFDGDRDFVRAVRAGIVEAALRDSAIRAALHAAVRRVGSLRATLPSSARAAIQTPHAGLVARRAAAAGLTPVSEAQRPLEAGRRPAVIDTVLGRQFAAAVGAPVRAVPEAEDLVVLVVGDEPAAMDVERAVALADAGHVVVALMLGAPTELRHLPPSLPALLAWDLPIGLWPAAQDVLSGTVPARGSWPVPARILMGSAA